MMKFIFGMQINIEVFYKLILSFWVCNQVCPKDFLSNKEPFFHTKVPFLASNERCPKFLEYALFTISLQYLKKEMSDEVYFLYADKHGSLLQIGTMILTGIVKHSESSQNSKFVMSLQYLKKEVRDEVSFFACR